VLTHGLGKVIEGNFGLLVAAVLIGLLVFSAVWRYKLEFFKFIKYVQFHIPNIKFYLFAVCIPAMFVVVGYTAATPAILGVSLFLGELVLVAKRSFEVNWMN
jgi:hypothetical protein